MRPSTTEQSNDYLSAAGPAAIGARLRRLSAAIDADATRVYAALGVRFEQRWFGVINQLALNGPMSVTDLAARLGITHVSVSQARKSLEAKGLVISSPHRGDARRRELQLSQAGLALVHKLRPLWDLFDQAARDIDAEAGDVVHTLDRLEIALRKASLFDRIMERRLRL